MDTAILVGVGLVVLVLAWRWRRPVRSLPPVARPTVPERADATGVGTDAISQVEIEDAIDLHGFRPRDILPVVDSYLEAAVEKGFSEVRLIHGKGKGVQRRRVQDLLSRHPLVEGYRDAPAHRGGWGATIAWLKPPDTDPG